MLHFKVNLIKEGTLCELEWIAHGEIFYFCL